VDRLQPTNEPQNRPTPASWLVGLTVLLILAVALGGGWLFLANVIVPMIPQRLVPNPESYRGIGDQLTFLEVEPLTPGSPRFSISDVEDEVILLSFWGTWCPPCRKELPHIAALRQRFAGQQAFRLVPISYPALGQEDDLPSLRQNTDALLRHMNLDLPTYYDPNDMTRAAVDQLIGFEGFPTTILLGRHAVVRAVWVGYRPGMETEIERYIDRALGEGDGGRGTGD
jgi:thiol-disulfide isomerase/thioredoxin